MKTAQDFLNDGNKRIICGDLAGSFFSFTDAISIDPTDSSAYIRWGFVREELYLLVKVVP